MYAICRRNEAELNKLGDAFGVEKRYTKLDDVLADPNVDAVHINSPIPDHAPQSLAALQAGKHVACTVPMATSVDECRQIGRSPAPVRKNYMMMETVVYSREFLFVKQLYESGELGRIQFLRGIASARYGRLARLLGRPAADALRHALREPLPGTAWASTPKASSATARGASAMS